MKKIAKSEAGVAVDQHATYIVASTIIIMCGMLFGETIAGQFAVSNLAQVIAAMLLLPLFQLLKAVDVAFILVSLAGVAAAAFQVKHFYDYVLNLGHLLFFLLSGIILLLYVRISASPQGFHIITRGMKIGLQVSLVIVAFRAVYEFTVIRSDLRRHFGFDDKSHAAVAFGVLALLAMRLLTSKKKWIVSYALILLSISTISRLSFLFFGLLLIASFSDYRALRKKAKTVLDVFTCHLLVLFTLAVPALIAANADTVFRAVERMFNGGEAADMSTWTRFAIAELTMQLIMSNPLDLFFGVTPGGFAGVVHGAGLDLSPLASYNFQQAQYILSGEYQNVPMHSLWLSVVLEAPLWVAILFFAFFLRRTTRLVMTRDWPIAFVSVGLAGAGLTYSVHNELYFWLAMIVIATFSSDGQAAASGEKVDAQSMIDTEAFRQRPIENSARPGSLIGMGH